jgi:hypothetical protein
VTPDAPTSPAPTQVTTNASLDVNRSAPTEQPKPQNATVTVTYDTNATTSGKVDLTTENSKDGNVTGIPTLPKLDIPAPLLEKMKLLEVLTVVQ